MLYPPDKVYSPEGRERALSHAKSEVRSQSKGFGWAQRLMRLFSPKTKLAQPETSVNFFDEARREKISTVVIYGDKGALSWALLRSFPYLHVQDYFPNANFIVVSDVLKIQKFKKGTQFVEEIDGLKKALKGADLKNTLFIDTSGSDFYTEAIRGVGMRLRIFKNKLGLFVNQKVVYRGAVLDQSQQIPFYAQQAAALNSMGFPMSTASIPDDIPVLDESLLSDEVKSKREKFNRLINEKLGRADQPEIQRPILFLNPFFGKGSAPLGAEYWVEAAQRMAERFPNAILLIHPGHTAEYQARSRALATMIKQAFASQAEQPSVPVLEFNQEDDYGMDILGLAAVLSTPNIFAVTVNSGTGHLAEAIGTPGITFTDTGLDFYEEYGLQRNNRKNFFLAKDAPDLWLNYLEDLIRNRPSATRRSEVRSSADESYKVLEVRARELVNQLLPNLSDAEKDQWARSLADHTYLEDSYEKTNLLNQSAPLLVAGAIIVIEILLAGALAAFFGFVLQQLGFEVAPPGRWFGTIVGLASILGSYVLAIFYKPRIVMNAYTDWHGSHLFFEGDLQALIRAGDPRITGFLFHEWTHQLGINQHRLLAAAVQWLTRYELYKLKQKSFQEFKTQIEQDREPSGIKGLLRRFWFGEVPQFTAHQFSVGYQAMETALSDPEDKAWGELAHAERFQFQDLRGWHGVQGILSLGLGWENYVRSVRLGGMAAALFEKEGSKPAWKFIRDLSHGDTAVMALMRFKRIEASRSEVRRPEQSSVASDVDLKNRERVSAFLALKNSFNELVRRVLRKFPEEIQDEDLRFSLYSELEGLDKSRASQMIQRSLRRDLNQETGFPEKVDAMVTFYENKPIAVYVFNRAGNKSVYGQRIFVAEAYRRKGIGSRLYAKIIEYAQGIGMRQFLASVSGAEKAQAFHKSFAGKPGVLLHQDETGQIHGVEIGLNVQGIGKRSEVRAAQTEILYPEISAQEIADAFKTKLGDGGVTVRNGVLTPQDFDKAEFHAGHNPWALEYGVRADWTETELLPAIETISNEMDLAAKDSALRVMVKHNLDKGLLTQFWSEMPIVPQILFPLDKTPKLPAQMQGTHSVITFNLIPGKQEGSYLPVMIKTGEARDLEQEAIMDSLFDRADLKEFVGVVNLEGQSRGIVYRIIPAQNEMGKWGELLMEFSTNLLALKGPPSTLKTKAGSVPYDLAESFKAAQSPSFLGQIIQRYNEIYAEEKDAESRSEVRSLQEMAEDSRTASDLLRKGTALYSVLRDSGLEEQIEANRGVLGSRDTEVFKTIARRTGHMEDFWQVVKAIPDSLGLSVLTGMTAADIIEKLNLVIQDYEMVGLAQFLFDEIVDGAITPDTAEDISNLSGVGLEAVIQRLEALLENARKRQRDDGLKGTAYVTASLKLISELLSIVQKLKVQYPEGGVVGLAIAEAVDELGAEQITDQHERALASLSGLINRMMVIGKLPAQFQEMLNKTGFKGIKLMLEGKAQNVKAPDGQDWVPVVEVGDSLSGSSIPPEILRVILGEEGYEQDHLSFYTLSVAVALQYAYSVMAALQLKKNMEPSEISEKLLAQLGLTAENPFVMDGDKIRVMVNLVQSLITEFQARSEIRKAA